MRKRYELQKQLADGRWEDVRSFAAVEEANAHLGKVLDGKNDHLYRVTLYDGDMRVGWKDFLNHGSHSP